MKNHRITKNTKCSICVLAAVVSLFVFLSLFLTFLSYFTLSGSSGGSGQSFSVQRPTYRRMQLAQLAQSAPFDGPTETIVLSDFRSAEALPRGHRSINILHHDFEATGRPFPAVKGLPSTLAFTAAMWIRQQKIASGERCLASHGGPEGRWTLSLIASGNLKLQIVTAGGVGLEFLSILTVLLDEWTHVRVGYDGETCRAAFYLNGNLVPHSAPTEIPDDATAGLPLQQQTFFIGVCTEEESFPGSRRLFTGSIGGLQVWDSILSEEEQQGEANQLLWAAQPAPISAAGSKLVFSMSGVAAAADHLSTAQVPLPEAENEDGSSSHSALFASRLSGFVSCSLPSPAPGMLQGVRKPGSITVMAWLKLKSLPKQKEACILSQGSWEHGWKLSIIPYLNVQFSVRTISGETLDYFSAPITPSLRWQHIAVTYSADDATVAFYANGFPLDLDAHPKVSAGKAHAIVGEAAPLTIGRCSPYADADETLEGQLTDVMIWDGALDFQAVRSAARGITGNAGGVLSLRRRLPDRELLFAMPATGCIGQPAALPSLPAGMAPQAPTPVTKARHTALQDTLLQTAIVLSSGADISLSLRVLDSVDRQASSLLSGGRFGVVRTVILVDSDVFEDVVKVELSLDSRFDRLEVEFVPREGRSVVHAAAGALRQIQHSEQEFGEAMTTRWVLLLTDFLKPLEHWLHQLLANAVPDPAAHHASQKAPLPAATKSLTLTSGGMVKSVGLKHYLMVVGDGDVVPAPFLSRRGYKASYVKAVDPQQLAAEAEATTCESLLITSDALLSGVKEVPEEGMGHLYECATLTAPLALQGSLKVAVGSWVLELQPPKVAARWDAGADSMLNRHEEHKESLLRYAALRGDAAMQHINSGLELDLRVKWMFACGGSWAWEAANLVEHLERRLPLRAQMQTPMKYCSGHNVLGDAPLSFAERVERMIELPGLEVGPTAAADLHHNATAAAASAPALAYRTPFPKGTSFLQDDVLVYHRDWFKASNWANWGVQRPRYQVGRYMNEVSGLHARVVQQCNALDEVWVPSKHHVEVFSQAGVDRSKLVVIPESIDPGVFNPHTMDPLMLPGRKRFVFLSNFKFEERKNWKQLIWAYCKAFTAQDDVSLYIHTNLRGKFDSASMQAIKDDTIDYIEDFVLDGSTKHKDNSTLPHWELTGKPLSTEAMIGLYRSADAYVLPTHGEGWGLPYAEAMTMGIPTIATNWGGNLEFMNPNNSLLVRVSGFEPSDPYDDWLRNFHWATPDVQHLADLMAWCFYNPEKAKELGRRARADMVEKFSNAAVAEVIMDRLKVIQKILKAREEEKKQPTKSLGMAFQWTIAPDVKLCANAPRAGLPKAGTQQAEQGHPVPRQLPHPASIVVQAAEGTPEQLDKAAISTAQSTPKARQRHSAHPDQPGAVRREEEALLADIEEGGSRLHGDGAEEFSGKAHAHAHAQAASTAAGESALPAEVRPRAHTDHMEGRTDSRRRLAQLTGGVVAECPSTPTRVAFITPFTPRRDGLAHYAASLREATLQACPTLEFDVFAIVLDFFSSYSEPYNATNVAYVMFRESWVDYQAAADVINTRFDAAVLNFKLGALGGTSSSYAVCLVKSITKPVISIVHSVHPNIDDALQFNLLHLLADSDAAVVMSHRAMLHLDTGVGFIPSPASMLRPSAIHVLPHGAPALPEPSSQAKIWAKEKLGMAGKRVLVTAGMMGPDKGVVTALHALDKLPMGLRKDLIYVVAGQPADCGSSCIEYYSTLQMEVNELNLTSHVALMPKALTPEGWADLWAASDVALQIYPEDLIPHPATFYQAMAAGVVPVSTPFAAALAMGSEENAVLAFDRDPLKMAAALEGVLALPPDGLIKMQRRAWKAAQEAAWSKVGRSFWSDVLLPAVQRGRAGNMGV